MNDLRYGGSCAMYYNEPGDWGSGKAIAYLPLSTSSAGETFAQVLHHEAGGHGFAKLADEYWSGNETITSTEIEGYKSMESYGFYKNGDFTNDKAQVKWKHFLDDSRYTGEVGIYEGGFAYYAHGVYRPTEDSIMRSNAGAFNAPSRETIYYRIHKLAYGSEWTYKFEDFVTYDAINRSSNVTPIQQRRKANYVEKPFVPTAPPVIIRER